MIPGQVAGQKVSLRTWEPSEAGRYVEMRDSEVFRFTTESRHLDAETARDNITRALTDPNLVPFAICDLAGDPVGNLAVSRLGKRVVLAYWLTAEARGRGWAADALRTASEWALATWDIDHLELEIDPENEASIAVAESSGYHRHGLRLESACGGPALLFRHSRLPTRAPPGKGPVSSGGAH